MYYPIVLCLSPPTTLRLVRKTAGTLNGRHDRKCAIAVCIIVSNARLTK